MLACLIEKEATVPDSYPLTLNALRLACNQTSNRNPVVSYDDRTVEAALLSLKSMGLVRFVHPAHGGRTTRYRHMADERWRLSPGELGVLATLVLRGPQTVAEVRGRVERRSDGDTSTVEEILDTLAARGPEPLAVRLERRSGERDVRFAHLLGGEVDDVAPAADPTGSSTGDLTGALGRARPSTDERLTELTEEVHALRSRLDTLERLLGIDDVT